MTFRPPDVEQPNPLPEGSPPHDPLPGLPGWDHGPLVGQTGKPQQPQSGQRSALGTIGRVLLTLGILALSVGKYVFIALKSLKFFSTAGSMLISIAAYTVIFGLPFAVGFVLLILVHELGHVYQAKREGLDVSAPMFIPFLGAAILLREQPQNALVEARIGIAGPIAGSLGALVTYGAALEFNSELLQALAYTGFFLNLFNLIPISPLDGGRIVAAISPKLWAVGVVGLVALLLYSPNPILFLFLLLFAWVSWKRWQQRGEDAAYYAVSPHARALVGTGYLGLVAILGVLMQVSHLERTF